MIYGETKCDLTETVFVSLACQKTKFMYIGVRCAKYSG
jgi:hypothetical protein